MTKGHFGQVLILAEHERHIVGFLVGQAHNVQCETDIHAFFLPDQEGVGLSARKPNRLITVAKRPGENVNALSSHLCEFGRPKMIPKRIVGRVRDPCVEADLAEIPILLLADCRSESGNIVIRVAIAESAFGCVEQVLAIDENGRSFDCGLSEHGGKK